MNVRPYINNDYKAFKAWHEARNLVAPPKHALPKSGFIVDNVAMGFMYSTDSSIAYIEGFVANKEAPAEQRALAIDLICKAIMTHAKNMGFKVILGVSNIESICTISQTNGFQVHEKPYKLLVNIL
jgi:hypothetical protein